MEMVMMCRLPFEERQAPDSGDQCASPSRFRAAWISEAIFRYPAALG
jgi:hypothetical protein